MASFGRSVWLFALGVVTSACGSSSAGTPSDAGSMMSCMATATGATQGSTACRLVLLQTSPVGLGLTTIVAGDGGAPACSVVLNALLVPANADLSARTYSETDLSSNSYVDWADANCDLFSAAPGLPQTSISLVLTNVDLSSFSAFARNTHGHLEGTLVGHGSTGMAATTTVSAVF